MFGHRISWLARVAEFAPGFQVRRVDPQPVGPWRRRRSWPGIALAASCRASAPMPSLAPVMTTRLRLLPRQGSHLPVRRGTGTRGGGRGHPHGPHRPAGLCRARPRLLHPAPRTPPADGLGQMELEPGDGLPDDPSRNPCAAGSPWTSWCYSTRSRCPVSAMDRDASSAPTRYLFKEAKFLLSSE
jgi:hypothetical protein